MVGYRVVFRPRKKWLIFEDNILFGNFLKAGNPFLGNIFHKVLLLQLLVKRCAKIGLAIHIAITVINQVPVF